MKPERKPEPDVKIEAKIEMPRMEKVRLIKPVKPELSGVDLVEAYAAEPITRAMIVS